MKRTLALYMLLAFMAVLIVTPSPGAAQADHRIFISIRNGDLVAVRAFVGEDPGLVSVTDRNGMTPLLAASYYGKAEIVEYLIGAGADVDYQRSNGDTAVQFAAWFDFLDVVRLLHEAGADIGHRDSNNRRPLDSAIASGSRAVASYLIEAGQSVPASSSLLHNAAAHGMKEVVDLMIGAGARIDAPDGGGGTILHSASAGGLVDLSRMALEAGMDVNLANGYGKAPIHLACMNGHTEQIRFLVSNGADIGSRLPDGRTPWHLADEAGHTEAAEAVAALGADPAQIGHMMVPDDRYLGQEEPGLEPVVFAPGIISVEDGGHGAPAISPRGDEIYWAKNYRSVWYIKKEDGKWSLPAPAPLWEKYGATNPVFSADGKRLFFHSSLDMEGGGGRKDNDIYYVERTRDGWGEPVPVGAGMNMETSDMLVSVAKNGTAYFTADYDLYVSHFRNGTYSTREKLPEPVNSGDIEMSPCIARDGSFLIFESMRPGGYSELELYITFRGKDGAWTAPVNMGYSINRGGSRFPGLSPDGKYLFFISSRTGNPDVYWVDAKIIDSIRRARPGMIDELMYGVITEGKAGKGAAERIDSAIALYNRLKTDSPGYYDFGEGMLNALGYRLLGEERFHEAIAVFQLNTEVFPGSGNVFDSLGEAYMSSGDDVRALVSYERALELAPENANASEMVERLRCRSTATCASMGMVFNRARQPFLPRNTNKTEFADLDGDGDLDAVCANMGLNKSAVWVNDGSAGFTDSGQELTHLGHGVGLGDLDGDGDTDAIIVCAGYGDGAGEHNAPTRVYLNDGRGMFTDSGQDFGDTELSGTGVTLADVDGDGDLDALANYYGADNIIWINDGHGVFSRGKGTFPGSSTFGDLDGDGNVDLFSKDHEKGYLVMTGDGDGEFSERWRFDDGEATHFGDVLLVDIDSDGDLDALATNGHFRMGAWPSSIWLNDGTGVMSRAGGELPALMNSALAAADLDGDGSIEIICSDHYDPVRVYSVRTRIDESGNTDIDLVDTGVSLSCMEMFRDIDANDLDGDGDVDIFLSNFNRAGRGGPNEVWINDSPR